jgi:hypothetical protein
MNLTMNFIPYQGSTPAVNAALGGHITAVMASYPNVVELIQATGIDPNDLRALMKRIDRWEDWCRVWSDEGARHEAMAREAAEKKQAVTAAAAFIRASIYYHYGKHLFADHPEEFRAAHESMLRCYSAGALGMDPPIERVEFPYKGVSMPGWLHKPSGNAKPPV